MPDRASTIRSRLALNAPNRMCQYIGRARWQSIALVMTISLGVALAATSGWSAHRSFADTGHPQPAGMRRVGVSMRGIVHYEVGPCGALKLWAADLRGSPKLSHRTAAARLPVLVWIPDDALSHASTNYDGAQLAVKGVVVVTLPFASDRAHCRGSPGSDATRALHEQLTALRWVRQHIAAFGGDPARVTVVGIGSGARHAQTLLSSAHARQLFRQLAAFDGQLLPEGAGQPANVPVLLGVSRQPDRGARAARGPFADAHTQVSGAAPQAAYRAAYERWLVTAFGAMAKDAAHVYPATTPDSSYLLAMYDRQQTYGMLRWADQQAGARAPVFLAVASVPSAAPETARQVDRGAWPALLMNNPSAIASGGGMPDVHLLTLADTLSDYLVAFAAHGDPAVAGRPDWQAYDTGMRRYLELSGNVHTAREPLTDVLELHRQRSAAAWKP